MKLNISIAFFSLFLFAGCSIMRPVPSSIDKQFDRALIIINSGSLALTQDAEKRTAWELDAKKIGAVPSHEIMSMVKKHSNEEVQLLCQKNGIDSIVYIAVSSTGEKAVEIPATYSGFANRGFAVSGGHGGYVTNTQYADLKIQLIDASNNAMIWEGNGRVNADSQFLFSTETALLIADEMKASSLFRPQWDDKFFVRRKIKYVP